MLIKCESTEKLIYFDEEGDCYPTDFNIQKMFDKKELTGLDYVWYDCDCQWMTRYHRDSLIQIKIDQSWEELIHHYDSVNSHNPM